MHQAVCRLVASGVTVVAAAGNNHFNAARLVPASYNEVITVSALADSDGRPGALGGKACLSWGTYDKDDTFANFSNYGADVDLIAPGKCILSTVPGGYGLLSGTSMAAPHVTAAAALYKSSRPTATPAQVRSALRALGNFNWKVGSDPDGTHEPLLDVSHIVLLGDFAIAAPSPATILGPDGGTLKVRVEAIRAEDVPDPIGLSVDADSPLDADLSDTVLSGFSDSTSMLTISVPPGTGTGTYFVDVTGSDRRHLAYHPRRDRRRHHRPDDRPAVAGDQLVRGLQRRPVPRRGGLADGQGLDHGHRRLPGSLERRRRRVEQQGRRRVRIEVERAWLRGRARVPRAGAGPRRGRQLERLEPGRPVRRRGRAGRQLDADQERDLARVALGLVGGRHDPLREGHRRLDRPLVHRQRGSRWSPRGARSGAARGSTSTDRSRRRST